MAAIAILQKTFVKLDFESNYITYSFVMLIGVAIFCFWGRLEGKIKLLNPKILHKDFLDYDSQKFKREIVYWAGNHFEYNTDKIESKWLLAALATACLFFQVVFVLLWVFGLSK